MIFFKTVLTSLLSITTIFILSKIIGNKQISQMNMFDYINGITIGNIAGDLAVARKKEDIYISLIAMVVYSLMVFLMSFLTIKSVYFRRLLSGRALILIEYDKIYRKNLKKAKLDLNDVLTLARNSGYSDLSQISYAILENNGEISFLPKSQYRPVCPSDLNVDVQEEGILSTIILDGKLLPQNLRHTGNDEKWLKKNLKIQGYNSYSEIMIATINNKNDLSVYKMDNENHDTNIFD